MLKKSLSFLAFAPFLLAGAPAGTPPGPNIAASGMLWPWAVMHQAMGGMAPPASEPPPDAKDKEEPKA